MSGGLLQLVEVLCRMRDFIVGLVCGIFCMWWLYEPSAAPLPRASRRLQQAPTDSAIASEHGLGGIIGGIRAHEGRLLTTLHVAQLTPDGALKLPPSTRRILLEIGCADRNTMDVEGEIRTFNDSFLISFEPLLDKCVLPVLSVVALAWPTCMAHHKIECTDYLPAFTFVHTPTGTRGCSSVATCASTTSFRDARRRSDTTIGAASCCLSLSPRTASLRWRHSTSLVLPGAHR